MVCINEIHRYEYIYNYNTAIIGLYYEYVWRIEIVFIREKKQPLTLNGFLKGVLQIQNLQS